MENLFEKINFILGQKDHPSDQTWTDLATRFS